MIVLFTALINDSLLAATLCAISTLFAITFRNVSYGAGPMDELTMIGW